MYNQQKIYYLDSSCVRWFFAICRRISAASSQERGRSIDGQGDGGRPSVYDNFFSGCRKEGRSSVRGPVRRAVRPFCKCRSVALPEASKISKLFLAAFSRGGSRLRRACGGSPPVRLCRICFHSIEKALPSDTLYPIGGMCANVSGNRSCRIRQTGSYKRDISIPTTPY